MRGTGNENALRRIGMQKIIEMLPNATMLEICMDCYLVYVDPVRICEAEEILSESFGIPE